MDKNETLRNAQKKQIYDALLKSENSWITMSRLKISNSTYHKLKKDLIAELKAIQEEKAGDLVDILNLRLDDLYNKAYPKINRGDLKAIEQGRKILVDQAKLNKVGNAAEEVEAESLVDKPQADYFTNHLQELYTEVSEQLLDDQ